MENFPYYFYALLPSKPDLNCVGSREKGSQNDSICLGRLFMKRIQHFLFLLLLLLLASTVLFLVFIFVEIVLLLYSAGQSDTTIPILRQQGYKLIRYTGTMTRHFLLVCIVYFCWKKQARYFLVFIIRSFNYTQRCYSYMQIAITLRQGGSELLSSIYLR